MGKFGELFKFLFTGRGGLGNGTELMNVVEDSPYYPFCWKESEDGWFAVALYMEEEYKKDFFESRHLAATGDVWERMVQEYVREEMPEAADWIEYDSDEDEFCACSKNGDVMRRLIVNLKAMCEDDKRLTEYVAKVKEEEE